MSYVSNRYNTLTELPFICEQFQYKVLVTTVRTPVSHIRDLGVTMSSTLSWFHYIKEITSKARQKAAWVLSVFNSRSQNVILPNFKYMARSLVEYCCPLWNPITILEIYKNLRVSKKCSRTEYQAWWTWTIGKYSKNFFWCRFKDVGSGMSFCIYGKYSIKIE